MAPEPGRVIVAGTDGDIEDGVGIIAKDVDLGSRQRSAVQRALQHSMTGAV